MTIATSLARQAGVVPDNKESTLADQSGKLDFSGVRWGSVEWTNLCTLYLRAAVRNYDRLYRFRF